MTFTEYFRSLDEEGKHAYAKRCKTTVKYINSHLIPASREPRKALRHALADESNGVLTRDDILKHFEMISETAA